MASGAILSFEGVGAGYGQTVVLEDLSLDLAAGEAISLIGRNGVGKTTLLVTAMGHTTMHAGTIRLDGADITRMAPYHRAAAGIGLVPQEREIFPSLTVRENLLIGARPGEWTEERVLDIFPHVAERLSNDGNQLSGGEQQMLAIARALMTNPRVLLLDEPSEGLAPVIVEELVKVMESLRGEGGMAIILVEQNTRVALDFSPRTVVLDRGRVTYDGASQALKNDPGKLDKLIGVGA
jgi:branched-chain amino acid transport system ATP-binding protein